MTAIPSTAPAASIPSTAPRNRLGVVAFVLAIVSFFRRRGRNGLGIWALVLSILPALIGPFLIPAALDTLS